MIELTTKNYEKQRKKGIKSNEGYIFPKKNEKSKIIKVIEPNSNEYLKMKQHTINLLLENSVYLQELKIAIPEEGVKIDNILRGYKATNIKGTPLSHILNDPNVSIDTKISCLKQIGSILRNIESIRKNNPHLNNLYYNDIHEKNFLVTNTNEVIGIDFDSCSIQNNTPVQGLYSMMLKRVMPSNNKYKQCPQTCEDSTEYIIDNNLDLYSYNIVVLNFMYGIPMYMWSPKKLNKYLNYLDSIKTNKELLYALSCIYDETKDNINIDYLLEYIKEIYQQSDCTNFNTTKDMKKILSMKSDWI